MPPRAPAINALDLTDLGTRIGDRDKPLAESSMARIERCIQRFREFPAVLMPAKATRGVERHPWQPMGTQTTQQETALLSTGAVIVGAGNTFAHLVREHHSVEAVLGNVLASADLPPRGSASMAAERTSLTTSSLYAGTVSRVNHFSRHL